MDKVSVIVPIYNLEKYLDECLTSIINQDFSNLEIILVNDGSKDASLEIMKRYADRDSRIKIINGLNGGCGAARNRGIEIATGRFLTFIDGDDFVDQDYVTTLVNQQKRSDSDIAITFNKEFHDDSKSYYVMLDPAPESTQYDGVYSPEEWLTTFFNAPNMTFNNANMKLYKRELFNNVRYPEKHMICEDAFTTWKLVTLAKRISFENKLTYVYRKNHSGSITTEAGDNGFKYAVLKAMNESIALLGFSNLNTEFMNDEYKSNLKQLIANNYKNANMRDQAAYRLSLIEKYKREESSNG